MAERAKEHDSPPVNGRSDAEAMDNLKDEVAKDLGLDDDIHERGWGNMTTREVGKIGGQMVRRLVKKGEKELRDK